VTKTLRQINKELTSLVEGIRINQFYKERDKKLGKSIGKYNYRIKRNKKKIEKLKKEYKQRKQKRKKKK